MLKSFGGALQLSGKDVSSEVGYMLKGMTQTREENTIAFEFGENVTLLQKSDRPPTSWLISSGSSQAWVPSYILTASKAEVDFLRNNNAIPDSITFVYGKDLRVWGIGTLHVFRSKVAAYCMGNTRMPLDEDCSQSVDYDGNAVLFDEEAARAIQKPPLSFKISPSCIYYCTSGTSALSFECIDLSTLKFSRSPLKLAEKKENNEMAELLRQHGGRLAPVAAIAIHDAARDGGLEKVRALLKQNPDLALSKDAEGMTPLHWAAMQGRKDMAELLIANRADINAKNKYGATPLHVAVLSGRENVEELLRQHGGRE